MWYVGSGLIFISLNLMVGTSVFSENILTNLVLTASYFGYVIVALTSSSSCVTKLAAFKSL